MVAALIAYPLVLEATTRLGAMSTVVAALTLLAFTGLLLLAAWRDRLLWLAWIGVLACLLTTLALLVASGGRPEFTGVLLILAAATFFWPGDDPGWRALRWAPAMVLDVVVLRAVLTSTPPVLFFSLALAGLSLALVLSRTARARPLGVFEAFQTVVGLSVGLTGALRVTREAGAGTGALAGAVLGASLLTAAFAGWVVPRRGNRDLDFLFHAALSLALLSLGVALLTTGDLRGVLWSAIALGVMFLGRRRHPVSLWSLAVLLALGAASSSGLLAGLWQTLGGRDAIHWRPVSAAAMAVLALVILDYLVTVPPLRPSVAPPAGGPSPRVPAAVLLLLASAGVAAAGARGAPPRPPGPRATRRGTDGGGGDRRPGARSHPAATRPPGAHLDRVPRPRSRRTRAAPGGATERPRLDAARLLRPLRSGSHPRSASGSARARFPVLQPRVTNPMVTDS